MRILLVHADAHAAARLWREVAAFGVDADVATREKDVVWMARSARYDAVVVDATQHGPAGARACVRLRRARVTAPIVVLADDAGDVAEVLGEGGAADACLERPVATSRLVSRLRDLAARGPWVPVPPLRAGDLVLDRATRRVTRGGAEIAVSERQFALLEAFLSRPGTTLDRAALLTLAWPPEHRDPASNVVDVYVRYLREKVDRPFGRRSIETVRGSGYRLRPDGGLRFPVTMTGAS